MLAPRRARACPSSPHPRSPLRLPPRFRLLASANCCTLSAPLADSEADAAAAGDASGPPPPPPRLVWGWPPSARCRAIGVPLHGRTPTPLGDVLALADLPVDRRHTMPTCESPGPHQTAAHCFAAAVASIGGARGRRRRGDSRGDGRVRSPSSRVSVAWPCTSPLTRIAHEDRCLVLEVCREAAQQLADDPAEIDPHPLRRRVESEGSPSVPPLRGSPLCRPRRTGAPNRSQS